MYIARAPFISGAERALMTMLRHLDRNAVEPVLVLGSQSELITQARELAIDAHIVPLPRRTITGALGYLRSLRQLRKLIQRYQPNILHANDVPSCQAVSELGAKLNLPRVIHIRWQISAAEAAWWARRGAERALCISRWMIDELGDTTNTALADCTIELLPDAVDWPAQQTESTIPPAPSNETARPVRLGFVGQITPSKGLDLVIDAMGKLAPDDRPHLIVAGEDKQSGGVCKADLESRARGAGVADRITWLGFLDDVSELYRQVDVVVCPSRIEPLGLVPLEAAAWSLPAIANRVGGLAETIAPDETGWLVEPTVEAWAQMLPDLRDAPKRRRLGLAAHKHVRAHYAPAVYQQRLMAIYRTLLR